MRRLIAFTVIALSIGGISAIVFAQLSKKSQQKAPSLTTDGVASKQPSAKQPAVTGGSIMWQTDLTSALEQAKSENKIVVVDVYTDWCGWCKKMDQVIYTHPSIVSLSREQVFLKLDAEDGSQGEEFAKRMRVRGFPTTIILSSEGKQLKTISGFLGTPERFIQFVKSAQPAS